MMEEKEWPVSPSLITEHIAVTLKTEAAIPVSPQYQHMILHFVKTQKSIIWAAPAVEVWIPVIYYTGLFEMIVGVLTTCHTHYTWDRSICIFLFIYIYL